MTDTVLLYVVFGVMLVAAIAAILPTFLRARPNDAHEDEHAAFLRNSLREEAERLEAEFAQGLHTEEAYRSLREDLERRAVEEMRETETTKSRFAPVSLRNAVIGVVALMVCVPVMCYQLLGAPEVMLLVKDQQVFQGEARDVEQIREYLKVNEKDARAWVLLARRSVEQEDYRTALDAYRKGRSLNEKVAADPEVMLELTATILTLNERSAFPEAKELVRKALGVDPESPRTLEMAAIVMLTAEDWKGAVPYLESMLAKSSPDTPQYLRLAELLRETKEKAAGQP